MDDLSASSQAQDWGAGVRVGIHLARQAVQLANEKVDSEDVNFFNTNKLGIAHAYLQPPSSAKRSAKAYNLVMDVRIFLKELQPTMRGLEQKCGLGNSRCLGLADVLRCGLDELRLF